MVKFTKMHGLGNDFIIIDSRNASSELHADKVRAMSERRTGIGCDQFIVLTDSLTHTVRMDIYNADGSLAEACGNAARCVGRLLIDEAETPYVEIETPAGTIIAEQGEDVGLIAVNMGPPKCLAKDIPLTEDINPAALPVHIQAQVLGGQYVSLSEPHAISMGNPHMVFFIGSDEAEAVNEAHLHEIDLNEIGPKLSHSPFYPQGTNVEIAVIRSDGSIRLRVFERGAGVTRACGTGACATRVAAACRGISGRHGPVDLDGGRLNIDWRENGDVIMSGSASYSFSGVWSPN